MKRLTISRLPFGLAALAAGVVLGGVTISNALTSSPQVGPVYSNYSTATGMQPALSVEQGTETFGPVLLQPYNSPAITQAGSQVPPPAPYSSISQRAAIEAVTTANPAGVATSPVQPRAIMALVTVADYGTPPAGFPTPNGPEPNNGANANGFAPFYNVRSLWVVEYQGFAPRQHNPAPPPGVTPATTAATQTVPQSATFLAFVDPSTGKYLFGESR